MHPVQDLVCLLAGNNLGLVGVVRHVLVADQTVGDDVGTWLDHSADEAMQSLGRPVENLFQPDAPGMTVFRKPDSPNYPDFLRRIRLSRRAPDGVCLAPEGHPGRVDLDDFL